MSEDRFNNVEDLISTYCKLVESNPNCLPPYATFKTYLVDEDGCCDNNEKCIDRPKKVKELVDSLDSEQEDKRLNAILELWSHGGKTYVVGITEVEYPKIIHSISNTTRLQVFLKGGKKIDGKGVQIDKDNLLKFADTIVKYIKYFEEENAIKINHELVEKEEFKNLIKNNIDSVINEILFWYYYKEDKYPIINRRAKNSRHIFNKIFGLNIVDDLKFNKICVEYIQQKIEDSDITITKQLMLDQLFYTVDDIKSMKKVVDKYSDENNEVYKFYKKLWTTVKKAKENKNLQKKYIEFLQTKTNKNWKKHLTIVSDNLHKLQIKLKEENSITSYDDLNKEYGENRDFLEDYIFAQENGIANAGHWGAIKIKGDKDKIKERVKDALLLIKILQSDDINDVDIKIEELLHGLSKHYKLVKNRFLAALFSQRMSTVADEAKFGELVKNLKSNLNVKLESDSYIDQNNELMGVYLIDDKEDEASIYDKQIFYWWLYEKLKNNLELKKAIVYYGAPGTGKTYRARNEASEFIDNWCIKNGLEQKEGLVEVVQFHPSFSYEDFIEGIRPSKEKDLELRDGVFKKFCEKAGKIEIALWQNKVFRDKFKDSSDFANIKVNDVLKTEGIEDILGIDVNRDYKDLSLLDIIPPAFFIIDEINRADLSRVFGELMYSLEYRGYEGKIKTQYSYLIDSKDDKAVYFWEAEQNYFFIPQNLYIIGTMNTIDRSVDSFDFALRRRFSWEEIKPDCDVIREQLADNIAGNIAKAFENLNKEITKEPLLGSDYQIGHSYALNLKNQNITNLKNAKEFLWDNFIKPLLQEYFRGFGDIEQKLEKLSGEFFNNA